MLRKLVFAAMSCFVVFAHAQEINRDKINPEGISAQPGRVDKYSGQLTVSHLDYKLAGPIPIEITRVYRTDASPSGARSPGGQGWPSVDNKNDSVVMWWGSEDYWRFDNGGGVANQEWVGLGYGWRMFIGPRVWLPANFGERKGSASNIDWDVCLGKRVVNAGAGTIFGFQNLPTIEYPDGGVEVFRWGREYPNTNVLYTESGWRMDCTGRQTTTYGATSSNITLRDPRGVSYILGMAELGIQFTKNLYRATSISDLNGNWLQIAYEKRGRNDGLHNLPSDDGRSRDQVLSNARRLSVPTKITRSDGAVVSLVYDDGLPASNAVHEGRQPQIKGIWVNNKQVVGYSFDETTRFYSLLSRVKYEGQADFVFSYYPPDSAGAASKSYLLRSITYPTGGVESFDYERTSLPMAMTWNECWTRAGRPNDRDPYYIASLGADPLMPVSETTVPFEYQPPPPHVWGGRAVVRVISVDRSDGYYEHYSYQRGQGVGQPDIVRATTPTTTTNYYYVGGGYLSDGSSGYIALASKSSWTGYVDYPDRHYATYQDEFIANKVCVKTVTDQAWKVGLLLKKTIGENFSEEYEYMGAPLYQALAGAYYLGQPYVRTEFGVHKNPGWLPHVGRMVSKRTSIDGVVYSEEYLDYDWFGKPSTIKRKGAGGVRIITNSYRYDLERNIIGLLENSSVDDSAPAGGPSIPGNPCATNPAACQ